MSNLDYITEYNFQQVISNRFKLVSNPPSTDLYTDSNRDENQKKFNDSILK